MKTEFLKELGLEQDMIDKIMAENGKDIESYKGKVKTLKTERDGLKAELGEVGKQIEEFKGLDVDGIKKAASEWQEKAEKAAKERDEQLSKIKEEKGFLFESDEKIPTIVADGTGGSLPAGSDTVLRAAMGLGTETKK